MAKRKGLKSNGRLKKGCRFLKGGRVSCKKAKKSAPRASTLARRARYSAYSAYSGEKKVRVSRAQATSGGRLKKGCRWVKGGGGAVCTTRVGHARKKKTQGSRATASMQARFGDNLRGLGKIVSRSRAMTRGGKLRKGCRFLKNGGAACTPKALRRRRR